MRKNTFISTMLLLAAMVYTQLATAATVGYSNGMCGRQYVFRAGSTTTQGMAIKLGPEKLSELRGRTISAIETAFGSRNTTGNKARLFIATDPADESPLREQEVTISNKGLTQWVTIELDEPYTISGDEGALYIGYTAEIETRYLLLSADYSKSTEGVCFAYKDGEWADIYNMGVGCANVRAVVDDGEAFADLTLKSLGYGGYYQAGTPTEYSCQLLNFGTETVTGFDIEIRIGDDEPIIRKYENESIAPGATFDVTLPEYAANGTGNLPITVSVGNVNGADDSDMSDNSRSETLFFYPEDMERNLLLEGFTGQDCAQCPTGHNYINSFLRNTDQHVIEVMHHIGYYPDRYTTAEDGACLLFYGNSNPSAPQFMMNRATIEVLGTEPVMYPSLDVLNTTANELARHQPYVSLKLNSEYDETTREAKIRLVVYAHNDLPAEQNVLNVMVVQDSIVGYQANGGNNYVHSKVLRGTTTGNAWGKLLPTGFAAGDSIVYEDTYTLPEAIYSSYWATEDLLDAKGYTAEEVTIPTDTAQTYLVAYVGAYGDENYNGHEVYNCTEVKLCQNVIKSDPNGIATAPTDGSRDVRIKAEGRHIIVEGSNNYSIYNVTGKQVAADSELQRGIYIVRATAGNKQTTKKIVIR